MDNELKNIEVIKWAFEKGYSLGNADLRDGIYIDFNEIRKCFLNELGEYHAKKKAG